MNGVLGMLQTLRLTNLDERQNNMLEIMEKSGDDLVRLLNDILEFSQMSLGELELNSKPFNLTKLIDNVESKTQERAAYKRLKFLVEYHPKTPTALVGDTARLEKVLDILLDNAVKFTTEGFVRLCVHGVEKDGHATIGFEVHDTGIGIDSDRQQDIFNAFQQVDGSKTRAYGGTGIGLALAQRVVKAMGSHITVDSTRDHGSVFQFTLSLPINVAPVASNIETSNTAPKSPPPPKRLTPQTPKTVMKTAQNDSPLTLIEEISSSHDTDELDALFAELNSFKKSS